MAARNFRTASEKIAEGLNCAKKIAEQTFGSKMIETLMAELKFSPNTVREWISLAFGGNQSKKFSGKKLLKTFSC